MKIYFVFKCMVYYPLGGWNDLAGTYTDLEEAVEASKELHHDEWSEIIEFDTETLEHGEIMFTSEEKE